MACGRDKEEERMVYVYQEFPKWKYHPERGGKIVQNAEEEKALGEGWYNTPNFPAPPKPSRIIAGLDQVVRPWWTKWQWIFAAIAVIVTIAVGVVTLLRGH
jgi:hypothetical protein